VGFRGLGQIRSGDMCPSGRNADPPRDFDPPLLSESQRLAMGHESFRSGSASSFGAVNNGPRGAGGEPATHIVS
jgi:hypothetical protein